MLHKSELEACNEIMQAPHDMGYDAVDIEDDNVRLTPSTSALSEDYGSKHRNNIGGQHTHNTHYTTTTNINITTWTHASGNAAVFLRQRRIIFLYNEMWIRAPSCGGFTQVIVYNETTKDASRNVVC